MIILNLFSIIITLLVMKPITNLILNMNILKTKVVLKKIIVITLFVFNIIMNICDLVNYFVILLHFFIFITATKYIVRFITKKNNHKYINEFIFIFSLIISILYLSYGYYLAHHVYETSYVLKTDKVIGVDKLRIVQISDSHIGSTMTGLDFYNYMSEVNKTNPDLVVITGDYVDDDTKLNDMIKACQGFKNINSKYGVYYVYGNHDKGYFNTRDFDNNRLRKELEKNNVVILEDEIVEINDYITLIGRQDFQVKNRKDVIDLTNNINKEKYIITLDHQPTDYEKENLAGVDLVLSGHTHGGQLIPLNFINKLVSSNNAVYGLHSIGNSNYIVSSGIGDWTIKFKTGTIAEYVVIDIVDK